MITVIDRERIRRAYYKEGKSMRQIGKEYHHGYWTIRKALDAAEPQPYTLSKPKVAPKLGPYKEKLDKLLVAEAKLPRKQRYTTHKLFKLMQAEGYTGSESNLRRYVGKKRRGLKRPAIFIPLQFDPGQKAQVDWGGSVCTHGWRKKKSAVIRDALKLFATHICDGLSDTKARSVLYRSYRSLPTFLVACRTHWFTTI